MFSVNLKDVEGDEGRAAHLSTRNFFSLGYPYFICGYDKLVACSSDYGILLF